LSWHRIPQGYIKLGKKLRFPDPWRAVAISSSAGS
jgi:hypothetical protein